MRKVKSCILLGLFALLPLTAFAQLDFKVVRGKCMPDMTEDMSADSRSRGDGRRYLPDVNTQWDSLKVYRQMVILIEYADSSFQSEDPRTSFDRLFNEPGFAFEGAGNVGCVADYFRSQSGGLFNVQFDVYGPYKVSQKAQPYDNPTASTSNYAKNSIAEATKLMIQANPDLDYSVYDWNGDNKINQVIYVVASYTGNTPTQAYYGFLWPHTASISTVTTPDGYKISNYSASAELWPNSKSCGLGTICHEYSHSLGLPDIYPTSSSAGYSVCDEWDLMDGGNFTNYGWCPCNYTAMEKIVLGWLTPIDLTDSISIKDMKPVEEGGEVYRIKHSASEWLLLENRQQRGWDAGAPGKGLVIYHVDYDPAKWKNNAVNNVPGKRCFELIHADNMDYDDWDNYLNDSNLGTYANKRHMNSRLLSGSPYPHTYLTSDSVVFVNDALTEVSVPAPVMNRSNEEGEAQLNKPITNIQMTDEGLISFDFMGGTPVVVDGIATLHPSPVILHHQILDLKGRRLAAEPQKGVYIIRKQDGTIRKVFK